MNLGIRDVMLPKEILEQLDQAPRPEAIAPMKKREASRRAEEPAFPERTSDPDRAPSKPVPIAEMMDTNLTPEQKQEELNILKTRALECMKCSHLVKSRTQVVFGVGNPDATIMFVGEAPGEEEDLQGEPFVGPAGQLLTKMIQAMGIQRKDVYIANILKCRPDMPKGSPGNRKPTPNEMSTCFPYLATQIQLIKPQVMVALGATAFEGLMSLQKVYIGKARGRFHDFRGIPVMPTYHPSYLLRNQSVTEKRKVWEDLLQVMEKAELPISDQQRNFFLKR